MPVTTALGMQYEFGQVEIENLGFHWPARTVNFRFSERPCLIRQQDSKDTKRPILISKDICISIYTFIHIYHTRKLKSKFLTCL